MEGLVTGASSVAFLMLTFVGSLPLCFLVGGGAAGTAFTMPVMAPFGDFAGVDRALVITTWAAAGWLRLILPINAILIAGLALAKVSFDRYVRFIAPLMGYFSSSFSPCFCSAWPSDRANRDRDMRYTGNTNRPRGATDKTQANQSGSMGNTEGVPDEIRVELFVGCGALSIHF
jgi:hypothetical protein